MRVEITGHAFDVTLIQRDPSGPLAAVILLDEDTPDRLQALARFWAATQDRKTIPDDRLTPQRRQRLRQMLRVVDGRQSGASYRAIAQVLFPHHRIDAASWAGNALRETTIRLARDGLKLAGGAYRSLLRRPRRS